MLQDFTLHFRIVERVTELINRFQGSPDMDQTGLRQIVYQILIVTVVAVLVGGCASLAAIGFVEAIYYLNDVFLVSPYARIQAEGQRWLVAGATVAVPTLGGLLVGLIVNRFVQEKRPLGPPDSIIAAQTRQPAPTFKSGLASTLATIIALGSGASVGQYGPLVYLGTQFGILAGKLRLNLRHQRSIAIACGAAAAISTAFNAPIAGLVFAHEVILRHYSLRAFAPVTVASATGYIIANVIFDRPTLFLVHFAGVQYSHEFVLFAIEGVLCAGLAGLFMLLLRYSGKAAQRLPLPAFMKPASAGLMLGLVALWIPEILGIGQEALRFATIDGAFGTGELALIIVAKLLMTALCLGFGFAGGIFSPVLLIGILFGAFYGSVLPHLLPVPNSGLVVYAICGMMALASAVIGAPLTTILIVFELTHSYDLTIAAMVAVVFSSLISYRILGRSLFDLQLRHWGFDLSQGRDKAVLENRLIRQYSNQSYTRARPGELVGRVRHRLVADCRGEAVVLGPDNRFQGIARLQNMIRCADDTPLEAVVSPACVHFTEGTSVWRSMELLEGFPGEAVPLVSEHGRVMGVVSKEAVIRAYLDIVNDLREEENEAA